jgi:methionyl-tRNA formyltransferase
LEHFKELQPEAQNATFATYAHKLSKEEAKLDWQKTAEELALMVRGYHPWPMAFTSFEDNLLRIYTAEVVHDTKVNAKPGEIIAVSAAGILVATGQYSLLLKKLQLPGGRPLLAQDLLNGRQNIFSIGQCFS